MLDICKYLAYLGIHLGSIGSRGLLYVEHNTRIAADVGAEVVCPCSEFDAGDVAQTQYLTFIGGTYDDVLELTHVVEQSVEFDVYLVGGALKSSDRYYEVLFVDTSDDFIGGYAIKSHEVGFEPDAYSVLLTHDHGATDTCYTTDGWHDVDVEVVGDKRLVEVLVGALETHYHECCVDILLYGDT